MKYDLVFGSKHYSANLTYFLNKFLINNTIIIKQQIYKYKCVNKHYVSFHNHCLSPYDIRRLYILGNMTNK